MGPPKYGSNTNPVQTAMILDHLRRTSITPLEALMAADIFDDGVDILNV